MARVAAKTTGRSKPAAKTTTPRKPRTTTTKVADAAAIAATLGKVVNQYDAAGMGRRMRGWNPGNSGPNVAIKGLQKIRDRARDSTRNDWTGASTLRKWTTNLIGTGIVARLQKIKSKERKEELTELWDDWCEVCDADNVLTFNGMQSLATRSWLESGEVFVRKRSRRADFGMDVPLQVQLIEADMVPLLDADSYTGLPNGNKIRSGIELDGSGQRVAYWVYKQHPGDKPATLDASQLIRVAASQMLHVFEPLRPGQLRGVPDNTAILTRLRNVLDFEDATLERQKLANLFAAFIKMAGLPGVDDGTDPLTGMPVESDQEGPIAGLEPGVVHKLLPGESMEFANPPEAGTAYGEYMRSANMGTAAGSGMPYELMSGDIYNISDRTLRIVVQEFRRYCEQRQWQIIIPKLCSPIRKWFVDAAVLAGHIAVSEANACKRVEWQPQGWAYIHPVQDVQAKQLEVQAGFRSRASVVSERGDDIEKVDQERSDDKKREDELGLTPPPPTDPGGKPGVTPNKGKQQEETKPQNESLMTTFNASLSRLETLVATIQAAAGREPAAPNVTVHAHIAAPNVSVEAPEVRVEPPNVTVTNNVEPTPVEVKVEPANVSVTNNVEPTPVQITNEVNPTPVEIVNELQLPDRKTTSDIVRDAEGNIKKITQVETTITH
jgi:lambda family phage portal protein